MKFLGVRKTMITGIILASGFSKRMQQEKLLLPVKNIPLIERVIRAAKQSLLDEIILVYQQEQVRAVAERFRITTALNTAAAQGQSAAIRLGVQSARPDAQAFMFLVGDQPYVNPEVINRLMTVWRQNRGSIIVPLYNNRPGNPVVFPAQLRDELLALQGDSGGRMLIQKMPDRVCAVPVSSLSVGIDIDTPEDYANVAKAGGREAQNV
jgi:molybdenum cofactor cytidylyltransferase